MYSKEEQLRHDKYEMEQDSNYTPIKYGAVLMRCQPPHIGHKHIIDRIISDGLIPVVILGSAQEFGTTKNPYHPMQRIDMIRLMYPKIKVFTLDDADCWDTWYTNLKKAIQFMVTPNLEEVTIYLHEKLEDLQDFTFRGIDYTNESYCKVYEVDGMHTTSLPLSDIKIRAQSIRKDLEGNKHYLAPEVYDYIKALK